MSDRLLSGRYRNLSKTVSWKWFGFVYAVLKIYMKNFYKQVMFIEVFLLCGKK